MPWFPPASKGDDGATRGGELPPKLRDEEGVVGQRLLHRQQTHFRDVEGLGTEGQRLAVVPLSKRQELLLQAGTPDSKKVPGLNPHHYRMTVAVRQEEEQLFLVLQHQSTAS